MLSSSPHPLDLNILVIFSSKNMKWGHKLELTYLMPAIAGSFIWGTINKYENGTLKVARKSFNIAILHMEVWNPVCCHDNKTNWLVFGAHLVEFYCEESKTSETYWLRYLSSSYLVKTWLSVWCHNLANLHILKTYKPVPLKQKEIIYYLKIVNSIFLSCRLLVFVFKMAYIRKMWFSSALL